MSSERRRFRREGEAQRQGDLIDAALDLIAEGGPKAATVRAIAERAGVTPGLIRHYFRSKEALTRAAYGALMARMTADSAAVLDGAPDDPAVRLAAFVAAALSPPVVDPRAMGLWAGFLHLVRRDEAMRVVHRQGYLDFRDRLQGLIAAALTAAGRPAAPGALRRHAIACNAVIDGLWLEGCALPEAFEPGELADLGRASVGAILGLALPHPPEETRE